MRIGKSKILGCFLGVSLASAFCTSQVLANNLLETDAQITAMQEAVKTEGSFAAEFIKRRDKLDTLLKQEINVPLPADAGGGYTHEVHKRNYAAMRDAGRLYLLTQDKKYADFVKDMLFEYADMYPTLPLHPKQKEQSPGKLFWQSLNEAVWLVYSIQGYDAIKSALSSSERERIENNLFIPMATYLSDESPQTFNKIHNHGTWATAGVGMAGYVLDKPEWVEKSLYGLDKSGKGGFMRQLDELFSPQGYYNEGPYYQRYALMPFVLFAKAIDVNEPDRKIFEHRDQILLKAITTTIDLSYNGLFFGINDAIKDKGIDTIELVHGVAIAYNKTKASGLLSIAEKQQQILLTGDGLQVAEALDNSLQQAYPFESTVFGDGVNGDEGALVVLRANQAKEHQALVFKATSQGLGHGHFDKLHWMFYNNGEEIVYDYGAARFLNVEAKYGGHYLFENNSYAKQTIAHNTLVVDETSHFDGKTSVGNQYHPKMLFTEIDDEIQISSATMSEAYEDVIFTRTQALLNTSEGFVFVLDLMDVESDSKHRYDLPVHFIGQFIESNTELRANTALQSPLGTTNGYQHLWLQAVADIDQSKTPLTKVTWLKDNTFYTYSSAITTDKGSAPSEQKLLMTRIGANDPNFNLIANQALINRVTDQSSLAFLSVLEVHGEYNGSREFTIQSRSQLSALVNLSDKVDKQDITLIKVSFVGDVNYLIALAPKAESDTSITEFTFGGETHQINGRAELIRTK
ncbi:alginate lyase family protein [Glaciecola sp. MH2013]|uniref:heparinase II/III domain-containing protein n=1 Tax=Glaciecola sp. MH2013 TaxID=2785524 RepID=UPI00189D89FF|nr:heparinase II/III family protein [Glaciecola sp. MH2013]MBF7074167.1 alginate lyase family protein [Glaciecola sp. MH2013]